MYKLIKKKIYKLICKRKKMVQVFLNEICTIIHISTFTSTNACFYLYLFHVPVLILVSGRL